MNPTIQQLVDALEACVHELEMAKGNQCYSVDQANAALASAPSIPTWRPITEEDKAQASIITEEGVVTWVGGSEAVGWGVKPGWFLLDGFNLATCADNGPFRADPKFTIDPPKL